MNTKNTKRRLVASVVAMAMCFSMFVGSTFAWFTDTASSGVNTITAGNLDIKLSYKNAKTGAAWADVDSNTKDLFVNVDGDAITWEPGAASICYFKMENNGSLALEYDMKVSYKDTVTYTNTEGTEVKLSDALKFAYIADVTEATYASEADVRAAVKAAVDAGTNAWGYDVASVKMNAGDTKEFALAVYMPESIGNTYNIPTGERALEVQLGIDLVAAQVEEENDSFGNTYDANADHPAMPERNFVKETKPYVNDKALTFENYEERYNFTIPVGAVVPNDANQELKDVVFTLESTPEDNKTTFELSLKDEQGNDLGLNKAATLDVKLPISLENVEVTYSGKTREAADFTYTYNAATGALRITTKVLGTFVATYEQPKAEGISTADEFIKAFTELKGGEALALAADIDMTGKEWTGVNNISFTLNGNGHTIKGLTQTTAYTHNKTAGGLVNSIGAGNSVVIKNLVIDGATVGNNTEVQYAGAVVGYADAALGVTLENVTVKNSNVTSTNYVAGLMGWNSGYANTSDGAVYSKYDFKNCTVENTTLTGGGSAGAAVGHAGCSNFTTNTIDNLVVKGTTVNGETGRTDKSGLVVGTANVGDVVIKNCEAADFTGNTVLGTANNTLIVGRLATSKGFGTLTINGTKYTADQTNFFIQ